MNSNRATGFSALILPKEHGSWSLAFEPVLLFLLVLTTCLVMALGLIAAGKNPQPIDLGSAGQA